MIGFKDGTLFVLALPFMLAGLALIGACHVLGYVAGAAWGVTKECRDEFVDQFRLGYYHMRADR